MRLSVDNLSHPLLGGCDALPFDLQMDSSWTAHRATAGVRARYELTRNKGGPEYTALATATHSLEASQVNRRGYALEMLLPPRHPTNKLRQRPHLPLAYRRTLQFTRSCRVARLFEVDDSLLRCGRYFVVVW